MKKNRELTAMIIKATNRINDIHKSRIIINNLQSKFRGKLSEVQDSKL